MRNEFGRPITIPAEVIYDDDGNPIGLDTGWVDVVNTETPIEEAMRLIQGRLPSSESEK